MLICDKCLASDETAEIMFIPILSSASAASTTARIQYCHWFLFVREGVRVLYTLY
jgi:hypothetical protein